MAKSTSLPAHIGFIIDGNRRWARQRKMPTIKGHEAGHKRFTEIIEYCFDIGIEEVSAYVFSTENWKRSQKEVKYLMNLVRRILKEDAKELHDKNVQLRVIGSKEKVDQDILDDIAEIEEETKDNDRGVLNLCFNYGGRSDIVHAAKQLIEEGVASEDVTEEMFDSHLQSAPLRDLDLVVRTSEARLSNFLLWKAAYAELYFVTDVLWPDFTKEELHKVLEEYEQRQRRFGK